MRAKLSALLAAAILTIGPWGHAAHVEVGELGDRPGRHVMPPPPQPTNPIAELLGHIAVHPARRFRSLVVFPLTAHRVFDPCDYATLDESVRMGWLKLSEVGEGTVPQVAAENTSDRYIFLMAGELITGGKQNRAIADDVVIAPHSGPIVIAVRCIERGRWKGRTGAFGARGGITGFEIRRRTQTGASQESIWAAVDRRLKAVGESPAGQDLEAALRSPNVRRALAEYADAILPGLPPGCVGMVVAHGHTIVGADVFCHARLFGKLRAKVLEAYALDAIGVEYPAAAMPPSQRDVRAFLRQTAAARVAYVQTPGAGRLARLSGEVDGSAMVRQGAVIHLTAYPALVIYRAPVPQLPRRRRE